MKWRTQINVNNILNWREVEAAPNIATGVVDNAVRRNDPLSCVWTEHHQLLIARKLSASGPCPGRNRKHTNRRFSICGCAARQREPGRSRERLGRLPSNRRGTSKQRSSKNDRSMDCICTLEERVMTAQIGFPLVVS